VSKKSGRHRGPSTRTRARLLDFTGKSGACEAVASWAYRAIATKWHCTPASVGPDSPFSDWVGRLDGFAEDFNDATKNGAAWPDVPVDPDQFMADVAGKTVSQAIDLLCGYVGAAAGE